MDYWIDLTEVVANKLNVTDVRSSEYADLEELIIKITSDIKTKVNKYAKTLIK